MEKPAFYYVYILKSTVGTDRFYTGFPENLECRLKDHKSGKNPAFWAAIKLVTKGSKSQSVCALGGKYFPGIYIRPDCLFAIASRITEIGIQA